MKLGHVALVYSAEEKADRFLVGALELRKSEPKMLSAELCRALFDHAGGLRAINYSNEALLFEVFIDEHYPWKTRSIEHVLLEVEDLTAFLERCRRARASIRTFPRGDSVLIFVADEDNNLFEIKEKKAGG
jgi:catechol 2,3-dioxygenase-like lactoylglutathione lyase family enzyme